jgi:putative flippase GtrA
VANNASPRLIPTSWAELRALIELPVDQLTFQHRFVRYFFVGGTCAVFDYAVFSALFFSGLHYLIAGAASFVFAVALNYWLSVRFVFRSGRHTRKREIFLVYLVSGIGIALNLAILALLVETYDIHPLLGKIAGTAAVFLWNFSSRYFWIFPR